ncbi:MAG: hypothetical protein ABI885_12965, partial [Gammaproteobacteria bacterium]
MKKFLATYVGSASSANRTAWDKIEPTKRKELEEKGMKAWGDWMATHKAAIVENGGPLGKTKRAAAEGVSDTKNNLAGYVVVLAESHDA